MIVGGKQDVAISNHIADAIPGSKSLTGQLTLRETFGVVAASDIVICNSSMLMHVAAAFSVRHLVLLGDYFGSAKAHQKQWGYEGLSLVLGKNQDRPQIFSAAEVFAILKSELAKRSLN